MIIENESDIPAKNPIMNLKFVGVDIPVENVRDRIKNTNIKNIGFEYGTGKYNELRWIPIDVKAIHKGIPIKISYYSFSNSSVNKNNAYIEVILSADNMVTKKFKIPVIIK